MTKNTTLVAHTGDAKKKRSTAKRKIALLATGLLLVGGGGAVASWSTTGIGSGSAANASANGTLALTAHFDAGLTPGASETVTYSATNAGTSSLRVATINQVGSTNVAGCVFADNFTFAPAVVSDTRVAGTKKTDTPVDVAITGGSTLTFLDTAADQDACKGAIVTLALTSN
jgi:hypothetical protein